MSGQPYRYAKDIENFRNEYMQNLNLRASLDDMNLQANKNYLNTGVLPPKSTMKDNRTTAEMLMDVEKLKQTIIGEFKDVTTPQMMLKVIGLIQSSPLNGDGSFLVWFAQNSSELATQLKKKYKLGIVGNEGDAENMYLFLQSTYAQTKDLSGTIKSAFDRPAGSDHTGLNIGDLSKLKKQYDDITFRLVSSPVMTKTKNEIRDQFNGMFPLFEIVKNPVTGTSENKYNVVKTIFNDKSKNMTYNEQLASNNDGYKAWIDYTDKLPSAAQLRALIEQLEKSSRNNNPDLSYTILENMKSIIPSLSESKKMEGIVNNIIKSYRTPSGVVPYDDLQDQEIMKTMQPIPPLKKGQAPPFIPPDTSNPDDPLGIGPSIGGPALAFATVLCETALRAIYQDFEWQTGIAMADDYHDFTTTVNQAIKSQLLANPDSTKYLDYNETQFNSGVHAFTNDSLARVETLINGKSVDQFVSSNIVKLKSAMRQNPNYTMKGFGLGKKAGRPKGSGIIKPLSERISKTEGIKQGHTHVPFGKYLLNKDRLNENILSVKHMKGYGIKGHPSKQISKNLSCVIKTIVGGGIPKYDDLHNLSNEEKAYLHNVSKKAGIIDKISIPTPSKDMQDRDIHDFEVMKGEILAGNDSTILIKKFKLLLLKLSKSNLIPKRETSEIMEDLLALGY
jgi:hypothetical protein